MKWVFPLIVLFFIFWVFSWSLEENDEKKQTAPGGRSGLGLLFALLLSPLLAIGGLLLLIGKVLLPILPSVWDAFVRLVEEMLRVLLSAVRALVQWLRTFLRLVLPALRRLKRLLIGVGRALWKLVRRVLQLGVDIVRGLLRMFRRIVAGFRSIVRRGVTGLKKFPRLFKVVRPLARWMRRMVAFSWVRASDKEKEGNQWEEQESRSNENDQRKNAETERALHSDGAFALQHVRRDERKFSQRHRVAETVRNVKAKRKVHKAQEHADVMHTLRVIGWSVRHKLQQH